MKIRLLAAFSLLIFCQPSLYANPAETPAVWSGNVQLGYTGTGGNSEDNNVSGKLNLLYKKAKWTNTYKLSGIYSDSNGKATADRYSGDFEWMYNFKRNLFTFARNNSFYDEIIL